MRRPPGRHPGAAEPAADARVAERERMLAERVLDDEALRGDLDDVTWQPLQDWLLRAAGRAALATAGLDDARARPALERAGVQLREVAATLAAGLAAGQPGPELAAFLGQLRGWLGPPAFASGRSSALLAALQGAARDAAARGLDAAATARRLAAALETGAGPARG